MSKETGGPAFAASGHPGQQHIQKEGMSLRDYFASQAIQAIEPPDNYVGKEQTARSYKMWAEKAYKMADAMLRARGK